MPRNLEQAAALLENDKLQRRVLVAAVIIAQEVVAEDPATVNHAARLSLAKQVSNYPDGMARRFLLSVVAPGNIDDTSADNAVLNRVRAIWDSLTG